MGKPSSGTTLYRSVGTITYMYVRRRGDLEAARSHGGLGVAATTTRTGTITVNSAISCPTVEVHSTNWREFGRRAETGTALLSATKTNNPNLDRGTK